MSTKKKTEDLTAVAEDSTLQATPQTQEQAADAAKAQQPVVYLGPTIEHVVAHGTVFTNGLPDALAARIEAKPFINGLIFPVSEYAAKAAAVATKGTALNTLYRKAAE